MDQPDPANSPGGFDFDQFIADHPEIYAEAANASGQGANQVAEGDRVNHFAQPVDSLNSDYQIQSYPVQDCEYLNTIHGPCSGYIPSFGESVVGSDYVSPWQMDLSSRPLSTSDYPTPVIGTNVVDPALNDTSTFGVELNTNDPQFESGFKVIQDKSIPRKKQSSLKPDTGIKCEFSGCKHKRSFNRIYDLTRHMKKHNNDLKVQCPVRHCVRVDYRYDKLRAHLETRYNDKEEAVCPYRQVEVPFMCLNRHVHEHEFYLDDEDVSVKACKKMKGSIRSCPIPSCKNHTRMVQASKIKAHLQEHHPEERISNSESILAAGYHPEDLDLICPVCEARLITHTHFQLHVETEHIFTDRDQILSIAEKYKIRIDNLLNPEQFGLCSIELDSVVFEHVAFLRPSSDYAPHRLAILRLWPGFVLHPFFRIHSWTWSSRPGGSEWPYSI